MSKRKEIEVGIMKRLAFSVALLWAVTYAYGQDVHYNYDRSANFQSYKTYQWVEATTGRARPDVPGGLPALPGSASEIRGGEDQLLDQEVRRAVDEQLAQKGLTRVEKGGDLVVTYHAVLREEKNVNLNGFGSRNYGWADASVNGRESYIPMGTLVVDLYDASKKQLIWRGDATKSLDGVKKDPNKNYKQLQKTMTKLFKNYPPSPNK